MTDTWISRELTQPRRADGKPHGQRVSQLNEELAEATARFFHAHDAIGPGVFLTVLEARMDEDFEQVQITLSIVPDDCAEKIFKKITATGKELRAWFAQHFSHWRYHPKIRFILDRGFAKGSQTWNLLDALKNLDSKKN